ncbi:hypothetical protein GCM10007898_26500 [Dyella flagellata]|uniref:Uncharacterized protein n=1 Tax=Dyella flagellata TaxID=1867833 RepID=A0ABQ5XDA4_9GAMM|nr:hypothetical protein GCM10007898_26500 [Dyella flagellata]
MRELIGAGIELGVRQLLVAQAQGDGIWRTRCVRFEKLRQPNAVIDSTTDAFGGRRRHACLVNVVHDPSIRAKAQ